MSHVPSDPTKPKDPVLVPRRRPDTVSLASIFMVAGAILGTLNAVLVISTTGAATRTFRERAALTAASPQQIDDIATGLATWSMTAGLTGLLLSVVILVLAVRVWRGNYAARIISLVVVSSSLLCGLGWSAFTVRGSTNLRPDGMDDETGRGISDALGLSTSGLPTYVGGGLTCLQVLGYIAVLGCLIWPASNPYFRRSQSTDLARRGRLADLTQGRWPAVLGRRGRAGQPGGNPDADGHDGSDDTDMTEPVR